MLVIAIPISIYSYENNVSVPGYAVSTIIKHYLRSQLQPSGRPAVWYPSFCEYVSTAMLQLIVCAFIVQVEDNNTKLEIACLVRYGAGNLCWRVR